MKNKKTLLSGFSLVELLVAISIMAILASILYVNFSGARASARDDIRKSDLKNLQLAIELYKAQTGAFPAMGTGTGCTPLASTFTPTSCNTYIVGLTPDYISSLPKDPLTQNSYQYRSDGNNYKLISTSVERKTVTSYSDEFARCLAQGGACTGVNPPANTYGVYSAGAATW